MKTPESPLGSRWHNEELKHEVTRLQRVVREPLLPADQRAVAELQLQDYTELLNSVARRN